ncbi:MAG: hypothetical protein JNL83_17850 [Myxococcales bacterium]|nr:hypothetical protein [Myxococcales bacterium]
MALLAMSLAIGAGCSKKKGGDATGSGSGSETTTAGSGSAAGSDTTTAAGSGSAAAGSASATAGSGSDSGSGAATTMAHKGGKCPAMILGATAKAELKDGKILLSITSDDKDAVLAIQTRTEALLKEKTDGGAPGTGHDQKGTHGGSMGICPVHLGDGGAATAKNEDKGVTITITPKDKVDLLKGEIDARITKSAEWVKENLKPGDKLNMGGVGGGSGNDGMNRSGQGDGKGIERKAAGSGAGSGSGGDGMGGGAGTGGGGGKGTGGGAGGGSGKNK